MMMSKGQLSGEKARSISAYRWYIQVSKDVALRKLQPKMLISNSLNL